MDDDGEGLKLSEIRASLKGASAKQVETLLQGQREASATYDCMVEFVENKAFNLLGFTGLLLGLAVSGIGLMLGEVGADNARAGERTALVGLATTSVLFLLSILSTYRSVRVSPRTMTIHLTSRFGVDEAGKAPAEARKELLASLIASADRNRIVAQRKASWIRRAQLLLVLGTGAFTLSGIALVYVAWT